MMSVKVKIKNLNGIEEYESLYSYCSKLSKRNNSVLYLLESYLDKKMLDEPELAEIRDILLTVSADITKIYSHLYFERGEENEGL